MELFASLFVAKPQNILMMAFLFLAGYFTLRIGKFGIARNPRSLLITSIAWGLYASWEWLVQTKTPDANIRVDLIVIWPVLASISAWGLFRAF